MNNYTPTDTKDELGKKQSFSLDYEPKLNEQVRKIKNRAYDDTNILNDMRTFINKIASAEKKYAERLTKLANQYLKNCESQSTDDLENHDDLEEYTIKSLWIKFLTYFNEEGKLHNNWATSLDEYADTINAARTSEETQLRNAIATMTTSHGEIRNLHSKMIKAQRIYISCQKKLVSKKKKASKAGEKLTVCIDDNDQSTKVELISICNTMSRANQTSRFTFPSMQKTVSLPKFKFNSGTTEAEKQSEAALKEYQRKVNELNEYFVKYQNKLPELFKSIDQGLYSDMPVNFNTVANEQIKTLQDSENRMKKLVEFSEMVTQERNLDLFLCETGTLYTEPITSSAIEYQPEKNKFGNVTFEEFEKEDGDPDAKGYPTVRDCSRDSGEDSFSDEDRRDSMDTSVSETFSTPSVMQAKVLYDHEAQGKGELTVKTGEYVDVFMEGNENGWCKVESKQGQIGFVPEQYLSWDLETAKSDAKDTRDLMPTAWSSSLLTAVNTETDYRRSSLGAYDSLRPKKQGTYRNRAQSANTSLTLQLPRKH
ncbi:F-BAR and double SH3 domains protein 2 [Trichoplax sp. H2]|nr:F-BAR and double SH3 domains protein 2 [Trichoplax sp. H2]|eukprot:RDD41059.1 F-BAR and double SH3 domains protein 2 [Trichoplax sp. H2]